MNDWNKNLDEIEPFGRDDIPSKISVSASVSNELLCDCGEKATYKVTPFRCTDRFYYCDKCYVVSRA